MLQKAIYHDPGDIETRSLLSQIYICLQCYYQAYYNLLPICTRGSPRDARASHVAGCAAPKDLKLLLRASCKIAKFDIAKQIAQDADSQALVQREESAFRNLVDERMKSYGESEETRRMFMAGLIIECKVPHLPSNKRNPNDVLSFVNQTNASSDIELRQVSEECYGLFAKRDFSVNETILEEVPYVMVNGDASNRCFHCCQPAVNKVKCCSVVFCSERCQNEARTQYHSPLCGLNISPLVDIAKRGKTSTSRFPLMCWKILGKALMQGSLDRYPSQCNGLSLLYRHSSKSDYMMPCTGVRLYEEFHGILEGTKMGTNLISE